MKNYDIISDAVHGLFEKGYTIDFTTEADKDCSVDHRTAIRLPGDDFGIDEVYRFQKNKRSDSEMIVIAISSPEQKIKGLMVNAYGTYEKKV